STMTRRRGERKHRVLEQGRDRIRRTHLAQQPWTGTRLAIAAVAVSLLAGCLYLPILHHPFINFDDPDYVTENPHVKAGLRSDVFLWAWTSLEHGNWHPLTWLSHAADVQVFGLAPAGHHFTSLLLHGVNAGLLFLVLAASTRLPGCSVVVAM